MTGRLKLQLSFLRGEFNIALITIVTVALSAAIVSVVLFIRANTNEFTVRMAHELVDCDVRVELSASNMVVEPTSQQLAFLDLLAAKGCRIETYRQTLKYTRVQDGYDILLFQFVSQTKLPDNNCLLSDVAADKLGLAIGDVFTSLNGVEELIVADISPMPMASVSLSQMGTVVLPESAALGFLEASDTRGGLMTLPLYIEITAPDAIREQVIADVEAMFPTNRMSADNPRETFTRDFDDLISEYRNFQTIIGTVLMVLSVTSVLVASVGIMIVMKLRAERRKQSYALMRINGMTRRDANQFALGESAAIAFVADVVGVAIGYVMYKYIVQRLTGMPPVFGITSRALWLIALKTFILMGFTLLVSLRRANRALFENDVMQIRQQRQEPVTFKFRSFARMAGSALLLSLLLTGMLYERGGIQESIQLLVMVIVILTAVCALFALVYGIFRLCLLILGSIRLRLTRPVSLSIKLSLKRREHSALVGSSLSVALAMLLIFYNMNMGMDLYFERIWESEMGYGASAEAMGATDARRILDDNGFKYDIMYRKVYYSNNMPQGTNASPRYIVAVLQKGEDANVALRAEVGTFIANWHFLFVNQFNIGDSFTFFGSLTLPCASEFSNLNTTGTFSSVSFQAVIDYADAGQYIDDDWSRVYILNPTPQDRERLITLGREQGLYVTTSSKYADTIRSLYGNYLLLIYLVCVLLSVVVLVFLFSLATVSAMTRRREFSIYRVYGASARDIHSIMIQEHACTAVIAALTTSAQVLGLFKLLGMALTQLGGVSYTMPLWVTPTVAVASVTLMSAVTLGVAHTFEFGRITDVLRIE
jgi:ABC-type antimicrobial peptide transport system permease subunit